MGEDAETTIVENPLALAEEGSAGPALDFPEERSLHLRGNVTYKGSIEHERGNAVLDCGSPEGSDRI